MQSNRRNVQLRLMPSPFAPHRLAIALSLAAVVSCGHAVTPADGAEPDVTDAPAADTPGDDAVPDSQDAHVETCFPPCLEDIFALCPPTTPCVSQVDGTVAENYCYANGSTSRTESTASDVHAVAYRADGTVCFRFDYRRSVAGEPGSGEFLDGSGRVVATFSQSPSDLSHPTVSCGGIDYVVDTTRAVCADHYFVSVGPCTRGTCSVH